MKFDVIVCDPPYSFSDKLSQSDVPRGAEANYHTMSISDIKKMPVKSIAADGSILCLWVPSSLLQDGLDIMKEWGFVHKQIYIWVKTKKDPLENFKKWIKSKILKHPQIVYDSFAYKRAISAILENVNNINLSEVLSFNMGRLFRQTHEVCLIGINNTKIYKKLQNKSQRSVSFAENTRHSAKPDNLYTSLDLMFPGSSKIDIFSRKQRSNWICIGDQSPMSSGEDINKSLIKLDSLSENDYNHIISLTSSDTDKQDLHKFWNNNSII